MVNDTRDDEQGELQGTITSLISLAEIIGPLMMLGLFTYTTLNLLEEDEIFRSPYFVAAIFVVIALLNFNKAMKKH